MSEQVKESSTVTISHGKVYRDAFERPDMKLYIPVDKDGNLVHVSEAAALQCWVTGGRNPQIPEAMTMSAKGLTSSLVKGHSETDFGWLDRTVAYGSLAKMESWLLTLHRDVSGDIGDMQIYYRN